MAVVTTSVPDHNPPGLPLAQGKVARRRGGHSLPTISLKVVDVCCVYRSAVFAPTSTDVVSIA